MNTKKEKFSGIALEMDVIKKIGHQLARVPNDRSATLLTFVRGWLEMAAIADVPLSNNGQIPLATVKQAELRDLFAPIT
jgi:hypothetical protein